MDGERSEVGAGDGATIGLISAGAGESLLLIHGGMGQAERWEPVWAGLADRFRVTAMDRRGRGTSTDGPDYSAAIESADIAAVIEILFDSAGRPVSVVAHSIGATFLIPAAAGNDRVHKLVLYEPPGPETVSGGWVHRIQDLVDRGELGMAAGSFLREIVGLSPDAIAQLRDRPGSRDVLQIVADTLPREAAALENISFESAARISRPTLLLVGTVSPPWATTITQRLHNLIPNARVRELPGQGHEAIDDNASLFLKEVLSFLT